MKKIVISVIAILVVLTTTATAVFAKEARGVTSDYGTAVSCEGSDFYREQLQKFEDMKKREISVEVSHNGGYVAKSSKFYARKVTGVAENGNFILGPWECVDKHTNEPMGSDEFTLSGTYVMFAYSLDIVWGTNFPYSGVFWDNINEPVKEIYISHSGLCRCVYMRILVNGEEVVWEEDCSSHTEWTP